MSPAAVTSTPKETPLTKALNFLRSLPPEDLKVIRAKLKPQPKTPVPRTPGGGIAEAMEIDDLLEAFNEREEDRTNYLNRYYFSKIVNCFFKEWCKDNGFPCDHGMEIDACLECRFDPGNAQPGNAVEDRLQVIMEQVYTKGKPGSVLKDMRLTDALEVECEDPDGKTVQETIYINGKTDMLQMGDNFDINEFTELKTPIFWPSKKKSFLKTNNKIVPLFLAGVEEPERPDGITNINNLVQLAFGVHVLRRKGMTIKKVALVYMNRERYREYIKILLSDADVEFLYELGVWWTTEYHSYIRSGKVPPPQFFMGYECRNCPVAARCEERNKADGLKKAIHPVMLGLNKRMAEANAAKE